MMRAGAGPPIRVIAGLLAMGAAGCSAIEGTSADRFTVTGELIAFGGGDAGAQNACFTCHGLDGQGDGAGTPRLAGLDVGYLQRQLDDYASGRRRHPEMGYIAARLGSPDRQRVSAYYAGLEFQPRPGPARPAPRLYVAGDPARGLPACAACHGLRGEGSGPANPALGAQPAAYLAGQMEAWRRSARRNDPDNVMLHISRQLTPAESGALAAYAGALPGGPAHPESPAAFPAIRRGDPRSGASALRPHEAVR